MSPPPLTPQGNYLSPDDRAAALSQIKDLQGQLLDLSRAEFSVRSSINDVYRAGGVTLEDARKQSEYTTSVYKTQSDMVRAQKMDLEEMYLASKQADAGSLRYMDDVLTKAKTTQDIEKEKQDAYTKTFMARSAVMGEARDMRDQQGNQTMGGELTSDLMIAQGGMLGFSVALRVAGEAINFVDGQLQNYNRGISRQEQQLALSTISQKDYEQQVGRLERQRLDNIFSLDASRQYIGRNQMDADSAVASKKLSADAGLFWKDVGGAMDLFFQGQDANMQKQKAGGGLNIINPAETIGAGLANTGASGSNITRDIGRMVQTVAEQIPERLKFGFDHTVGGFLLDKAIDIKASWEGIDRQAELAYKQTSAYRDAVKEVSGYHAQDNAMLDAKLSKELALGTLSVEDAARQKALNDGMTSSQWQTAKDGSSQTVVNYENQASTLKQQGQIVLANQAAYDQMNLSVFRQLGYEQQDVALLEHKLSIQMASGALSEKDAARQLAVNDGVSGADFDKGGNLAVQYLTRATVLDAQGVKDAAAATDKQNLADYHELLRKTRADELAQYKQDVAERMGLDAKEYMMRAEANDKIAQLQQKAAADTDAELHKMAGSMLKVSSVTKEDVEASRTAAVYDKNGKMVAAAKENTYQDKNDEEIRRARSLVVSPTLDNENFKRMAPSLQADLKQAFDTGGAAGLKLKAQDLVAQGENFSDPRMWNVSKMAADLRAAVKAEQNKVILEDMIVKESGFDKNDIAVQKVLGKDQTFQINGVRAGVEADVAKLELGAVLQKRINDDVKAITKVGEKVSDHLLTGVYAGIKENGSGIIKALARALVPELADIFELKGATQGAGFVP